MSFLVLAYPTLNPSDQEWLLSYRKIHDSDYFDVVTAHFSFVFPVRDFEKVDFIKEIEKQAAAAEMIAFEIHKAIVHQDEFDGSFHQFLIPDDNATNKITALHDRLYADKLKSNHRLDIPYIPHVAVGSSTDPEITKAAVERLNEIPLNIHGTIESLHVVEYAHKMVNEILEIRLK
ncbi:MAG: 2'-5' RNA ligase family protein [Bacteroidetes bacterium]|nr:2'-5' RNA ligase family protein [Bacteroidota bacterium]